MLLGGSPAGGRTPCRQRQRLLFLPQRQRTQPEQTPFRPRRTTAERILRPEGKTAAETDAGSFPRSGLLSDRPQHGPVHLELQSAERSGPAPGISPPHAGIYALSGGIYVGRTKEIPLSESVQTNAKTGKKTLFRRRHQIFVREKRITVSPAVQKFHRR